MASDQNYRLYAFVANHYLSQLQLGLQTAHVVGNMSIKYNDDSREDHAYRTWANDDKTIIILGAGNHAGVLACWAETIRTNTMALPQSIFFEDEQSMNSMATACGVVVPEKYWGAVFQANADTGLEDRWIYGEKDEAGTVIKLYAYPLTHPEGQFINLIKSYRLA